MNRRLFLQNLLSLGAGVHFASPLFSAVQAAETTTPTDFKAMVCILLTGGNDGSSMIVPRSAHEYQVYSTVRPSLTLPINELLPITPATPNQGEFGLHPELTNIQRLFNENKAAIVAKIGTLLEPTSKEAVDNRTAALAPYLFSHSTQRTAWQTAEPFREGSRSGWAGRMLNQFDLPPNPWVPASMSLAGTNAWQTGSHHGLFRLSHTGIPQQQGVNLGGKSRSALKQLLKLSNNDTLYARAHANSQLNAIRVLDSMHGVDSQVPSLDEFGFNSSNKLSNSLRSVARIIIGNQQFADRPQSRLTFYVKQDGYDTHGNQMEGLKARYKSLDASVGAFINALEHYGLGEMVTTFTGSDFGRTVTANGDGTDHGWGGHQLVFGGAVKGGDIYGTMPDLSLDGPDIVKKGRILPEFSNDQYAATLCRWFGVTEAQMPLVLPQITNFANSDLGFMQV